MRRPAELANRLLWPAYAGMYDGLLDVYAYRDMLDLVARRADCADQVVLDAGVGTGNVAAALLAAGAREVVGVDGSSTMLARARRKLAPDLERGRVRLVDDDLVRAMAAMPARSVDRITAVNVLYALPSREAFFHEAARLLRPPGFVLAAHTTRPGSGPIVREQVRRGGLRRLLRPRILGLVAVDLVIDLIASRGRYHFAPVPLLASEASAAGLGMTRSLGRTYGGPDDGVNELLRISPA